MPPSRIPESLRHAFTSTFTARDVAEPLASFDQDADCADIQAFLEARDYDVVGMRSDGHVVGVVEHSASSESKGGSPLRSLEAVKVVSDTTPLLTVIMELRDTPFLLVSMLGHVGGIITLADLQKPPVRMWLFGIVTLVEMRFAELIERHCPEETWKKHLSEGRLQKAQALLEERSRRNQKLHLLDCLQFSDKGQVIARNEEIRKHTVFASRSQAEEVTKRLEQLRNNLAHAQDILTTDWDTIIQICQFIEGGALGAR